METKSSENQIVIKTNSENGKQQVPVILLLSLAAGAITGVAFIFALFWCAEMLFGM